jgi:hypothetical protein
LLDDLAHHGMPPIIHQMDIAAHPPVAEHAGGLLIRAPLDLEDAADAARRGGNYGIGNVQRHQADAAARESLEKARDVIRQLLRRNRIRRKPCRLDCRHRHEALPLPDRPYRRPEK